MVVESQAMEAGKTIENFLGRVRRKQALTSMINGLYLLSALAISAYLLGNLISYFSANRREYLFLFLILFAFLVSYVVVHYLKGIIPGLSKDQAALLTEKHYPELKNSLINSWQLQRYFKNPDAGKSVSIPFIHELLKETSIQIKGLSAESVISAEEGIRNKKILLVVLLLMGVTSLVLPDFFSRGYNNFYFIKKPIDIPPVLKVTEPSPPPAVQKYILEDFFLKFNYPAYTGLPSEIVPRPEVHTLPGTEVQVQAKLNRSVKGGELIIQSRNHYSMSLQDNRKLIGTFMVKDQGFYQVGLKTEGGSKITLPIKYPITLKKDESPEVTLFPSNPKPVYYENDSIKFFYEGHDDFGIGKIFLMVEVNGKTLPKVIHSLKGSQKVVKGNHTWNIGEIKFEPGDEVQYYLEAYDNDNVLGPKSGLSDIFTFTVFNSRKELENLINLQDELIDKMIALLAKSLVGVQITTAGAITDQKKLKDFLASSADQLIEIMQLEQKVLDQADLVGSFPKSYVTFFESAISGLNAIRQEQIDLLNNFKTPIYRPKPVGYNPPNIKPLNDKLASHLERDILFLVKISNRQKIGQVMDMEMHLSGIAELLKKKLKGIKDKEISLNVTQLKQEIQKIKKILEKTMQQLARQTQGLPDEFINRKAFESLDLNKFDESLEEITKMVKQGQIDKAINVLEELTNDLNTLAKQLDEVASQMEDLVDMEMMGKLDKAVQDILTLEKEEKGLLESTTKINQSLRVAQFKKFQNILKEFFASLKKDVNKIQSILSGTARFLDESLDMKNYDDLHEQEIKLNLKIQELGQDAVDSSLKPDLADKLRELREARNELAGLTVEKDSLHLKTYNDFKIYIPDFLEKYNSLEELAELFDLKEFNSLYKNTYPDTFRWQHNLRSIPKPNIFLSNRLVADLGRVRELNAEISKKLGSMMVNLKEKYDSLLSENNKTKLRGMSKKQRKTREKTKELARELSQMGYQNPMISSEFSMKILNAGKYMKMAEKSLHKTKVPESIDSENLALQELSETREMLDQLKKAGAGQKKTGDQSIAKIGSGRARDRRRGGSIRMNREKINLPSEDQYKVPAEFRAEILDAMKNKYPKKYERFVTEYYKELVK